MTKKTIVNLSATVFVLGCVFMGTRSCVRATWERGRVKVGMGVPEVFDALHDWDLCLASSQNPATKEYSGFNATRSEGHIWIRLRGRKDSGASGPEPDGIKIIRKQMSNGQPWSLQFTYFGTPRSTFRVDFDANARVHDVSDIASGP